MATKSQLTIQEFIMKLQTLLDTNHGPTLGLAQRLANLQNAIRTSNTPSNDPAIEQLAENLNPGGAAAVAKILESLSTQHTHDLIDLQTAARVVQAYLDATKGVETIPIAPKVERDAVRLARAEIRSLLDSIESVAKQGQALLETLVRESADLAAQANPALDQIIGHLKRAVDTLRQIRDDRDPIDPQITRELAINWSKTLAKVESNITPVTAIDLQRVADLLTIHEQLDEAGDLLAEDISAVSLLDPVNI
jgi:hypothetical protein